MSAIQKQRERAEKAEQENAVLKKELELLRRKEKLMRNVMMAGIGLPFIEADGALRKEFPKWDQES